MQVAATTKAVSAVQIPSISPIVSCRAGVSGLTFHDLRGSAVVRLALAEATVPQIATFTGHSLKDVEAILDAHYLGRDVQLAEAAVLKLEKRTKL
jgi:integrase